MENSPLRVSMIEDDQSISVCVSTYISLHEELEMDGCFISVEAFLKHSQAKIDFRPKILLLDIGLPGMSGIEGIPQIKQLHDDIDIIMLTTYEEEDVILKALCAGACSYLSKSTGLSDIVESIKIVSKGGSYMSPGIAREIVKYLVGGKKSGARCLSPRQNEILHALSEGKSYKNIAKDLYISFETVKTHVKRIYKILEVNNRTSAVSKYLKGEL